MNSEGPVSLVLQNPRTKRYLGLGFAFAIMNALTFVMFLFLSAYYITAIAGLAVMGIYFLLKRFELRRNPSAYRLDENIFFALAVIWLNISILIGILLLVTGILLKLSLQKFEFIFSAAGIQKNFFPKKQYTWEQIDSVILRAGLLTINFKNNHLIQGLIEDADTPDEATFNDLMRDYIAANDHAESL